MEQPLSQGPLEWGKLVLRGVGQVMFQGHAVTGLLMVVGIFLADWKMGLGTVIGAVIGPVVAKILRYDDAEIHDGIYGFNSTLVGIAAFFFFQVDAMEIALLVAACAISTPVTWAMRKFLPFPTYTSPFIVTTWAMFGVGVVLGLPQVKHDLPDVSNLSMANELADAFTEGLSEVFLQANDYTGILFLVGLAVSNWRHAALAFAGSVIGTLVGIYHADAVGAIDIGIYGYNGSLAAIALYLWRPSIIAPLLGAIISTPITEFFPATGLPTLTAPFVIASWIVLIFGALEPIFTGTLAGAPLVAPAAPAPMGQEEHSAAEPAVSGGPSET